MQRSGGGGRRNHSETRAYLKNHSRLGPTGIENVSREVQALVGEADQYTALDVEAGLASFCSLCYEAYSNPVARRVCELVSGAIPQVEYIFARTGQFEFLVTQRHRVAGRDANRGHRRLS